METIIKERLVNYMSSGQKNEIIEVMRQIVSNPDSFVFDFYNYVWKLDPILLVLADIFSNGYLALRSVFLHSSLLNEPYTNRKPNAHLLLGEDINLLGSLTIIIEMNNELLRFISVHYPQKVPQLNEIIERTINTNAIEPFQQTTAENFAKISAGTYENYTYIVDWLQR